MESLLRTAVSYTPFYEYVSQEPSPTIERDNIKFPTFADDFLDDQLKYHFNQDSLLPDMRVLHESLSSFLIKYDNLFKETYPHSQLVKNSFVIHKLDYLHIRIMLFFFHRQIEAFYLILSGKLNKDNEMTQGKVLFSTNYTDLITSFVNTHSYYYYDESIVSENNEDKKDLPFDERVHKAYKEHFNSNNDDKESIDPEFREKIIKLFKEKLALEELIVNMIDQLGKEYIPSISTFSIAIKFILGIVNHLFNDLKAFNVIDFNSIEENQLITFFNDLHQMTVCCEIMYNFYRVSSNNIFNLDENGEEWNKIKEHFSRILVYPKHIIQKKMDKLIELVNVGYASISKSNENYDHPLLQTASAGVLMGYYFFNKDKAKTQSMKFLINPDVKVSQTIWNMLDAKGIKSAYQIVLPTIKYSKKWYIKRIEKEITLQEILELEANINKDDFKVDPWLLYKNESQKTVFEGSILLNEDNDLIKERINKNNAENKHDKYVKIKIIHNGDFLRESDKGMFDYFTVCSQPKITGTRDAMIIHIHGGGFIAMSPSSHENYTRKWSAQLNVPLMGIDYSHSPDYPFPKALDDVYQAYVWIINHAESIFNMNLRTIILAGDSAGGNLVLALTYLLIVKGRRLPNVLILAYPALNLSLNDLSPSYMNCLTDPILEYSLLKFCLDAYSGNCNDHHNPFMSPLFINDKILKYLPAVRIFAGSSDPLRDDSITLLNRLVKLRKDVDMKEFKYFPHGFLNYDNQVMLPEATIVNNYIIEEIEKFL